MSWTHYANTALRRLTGYEIAKAGTTRGHERLQTKLEEARDAAKTAARANARQRAKAEEGLAAARGELTAVRRELNAVQREVRIERKASEGAGRRVAEEAKKRRAMTRIIQLRPHFDGVARDIITEVNTRTVSSQDKLFALILATRYVVDEDIPGDVVECAVWRNGSLQAVAGALSSMDDEGRGLHRFSFGDGRRIGGREPEQRPGDAQATSGRFDVLDHLGAIEEAIPSEAPERVAILRLDLDSYESMSHALEHLYPRVSPGGVVLIDDYGWWEGARDAVDHYFKGAGQHLFLAPVGSGRIAVKPRPS